MRSYDLLDLILCASVSVLLRLWIQLSTQCSGANRAADSVGSVYRVRGYVAVVQKDSLAMFLAVLISARINDGLFAFNLTASTPLRRGALSLVLLVFLL